MATNTNYLFMVSLIILLFPLCLTTAFDKITAIYAFGDSIIDPGNNNNRLTYAKANFAPYGIDFPGRVATGRFSNGKIVTDFLASKVGLKETLPAYFDPNLTDQDLLTGCSFAIAGSGLDDFTSTAYVVPPFVTQLSYFEEAMRRMGKTYGLMNTSLVVKNAVFLVVSGSNDVLRNYYGFRLRRYYSLSEYHGLMLGTLETFVERLYDMGARKIGVTGLPPIGCIPIQRAIASVTPGFDILQNKCVKRQNIDSQSYNVKVQNLMRKMQQARPGSRIEYVDLYNPMMDMITNRTTYGFENSDRGCCGTGTMEVGITCNPSTPICTDPSKYMFWDAAHPTEKASSYLADFFMQLLPNGTA